MSAAGAAKMIGYSPAAVRRLVVFYDPGRRRYFEETWLC
jgi:hypothetical protein